MGKTVNLPLPRGTRIDTYFGGLEPAWAAVKAHGTDLLVLSYGADTFEHDPISQFKLREGDYAVIGAKVAALKIPTAGVIEGGCAIDALGRNVSSQPCFPIGRDHQFRGKLCRVFQLTVRRYRGGAAVALDKPRSAAMGA